MRMKPVTCPQEHAKLELSKEEEIRHCRCLNGICDNSLSDTRTSMAMWGQRRRNCQGQWKLK